MKLVTYTWFPQHGEAIFMSGAFEDMDAFLRFRDNNICIGDTKRAIRIQVESVREMTEPEERRIRKEFPLCFNDPAPKPAPETKP